jgi:hypothetical protein
MRSESTYWILVFIWGKKNRNQNMSYQTLARVTLKLPPFPVVINSICVGMIARGACVTMLATFQIDFIRWTITFFSKTLSYTILYKLKKWMYFDFDIFNTVIMSWNKLNISQTKLTLQSQTRQLFCSDTHLSPLVCS